MRFSMETFGPDRRMFAGDWPRLHAPRPATANGSLTASRNIVRGMNMSFADQKKLFHDNAVKFYALKDKGYRGVMMNDSQAATTSDSSSVVMNQRSRVMRGTVVAHHARGGRAAFLDKVIQLPRNIETRPAGPQWLHAFGRRTEECWDSTKIISISIWAGHKLAIHSFPESPAFQSCTLSASEVRQSETLGWRISRNAPNCDSLRCGVHRPEMQVSCI